MPIAFFHVQSFVQMMYHSFGVSAARLCLVLAGWVTLCSGRVRAEALTYPELVGWLTDLEAVSVAPPPGEKGALASSYDRSSTYDAASDKYLHWDANDDGSQYVRKEGAAFVLADLKGPGCIWRMWSATAGSGHVRIYLDGAATPVLDLPFSDYFSGKAEPFTRSNLVYKTSAEGFNNYTPVPFQKSCKIVADEHWGNYYHFNYTEFAGDTVLPTFRLPLSAQDAAALDKADQVLGRCGEDPAGARKGEQTQTKEITVAPASETSVVDLGGPAAITALRVRLPIPRDPQQQLTFLRQLAIRIWWDHEKEPAVWCPLGDFFADAAGAVPYRSLVTGLSGDNQWYSFWYMPFASDAHVTVENGSDHPVAMRWEVTTAPLDKAVDALLRFHAKWHRNAFLPERPDRAPDWTILTTQGQGRFVGTQLHIWNPGGGWWGEGDEKFFVDGEKFPSTFGTGSEDYFGYAWGSGAPFDNALHGHPADYQHPGHVSLHRWHIADNVPFRRSFEGCIEKYFPNQRPTLYAAVAFWYLSAGGTDPYQPQPVAERIDYWKQGQQ